MQQKEIRTQEPEHRRRILSLLAERPDGTLPAHECLLMLGERYGHLLNRIDLEEHSRGVQKWVTRARKSSSLMFQEGLIEKPSRGVWRLTEAGWVEARKQQK
jgi:hypothetical protein